MKNTRAIVVVLLWLIASVTFFIMFDGHYNETVQYMNTLMVNTKHDNNAAVDIEQFLFWKDYSFNISSYLNRISNELGDSNKHLYKTCECILSYNTSKLRGIGHTHIDKWSQNYQEWAIFHNFFYGKTDGIYLDIAARLPFDNSNSAFFDVCMGWNGICVEPTNNSLLFKDTRSCTMANKCVWSKSENFTFIFRAGTGLSHKVDGDHINDDDDDDIFECQALSATDLLNQYKAKNKYNKIIDLKEKEDDDGVVMIDYISLDIEGAELEFLKCFPFNKYDVKVWTIEMNNNANIDRKIDEIMYHHGYIKFDYLNLPRIPLDGIYVKPRNWKYLKRPFQQKWTHFTKCH